MSRYKVKLVIGGTVELDIGDNRVIRREEKGNKTYDPDMLIKNGYIVHVDKGEGTMSYYLNIPSEIALWLYNKKDSIPPYLLNCIFGFDTFHTYGNDEEVIEKFINGYEQYKNKMSILYSREVCDLEILEFLYDTYGAKDIVHEDYIELDYIADKQNISSYRLKYRVAIQNMSRQRAVDIGIKERQEMGIVHERLNIRAGYKFELGAHNNFIQILLFLIRGDRI